MSQQEWEKYNEAAEILESYQRITDVPPKVADALKLAIPLLQDKAYDKRNRWPPR